MRFIFYSSFLLLLSPCNSPKKISTNEQSTENSTVMITYESTACFGKCPVYTLSIMGATKIMKFTGIQNTAKAGNFSKPISDSTLTQLVKAFEKVGFTTLNDEYLGTIVDLPINFISFSSNGKTKKIKTRGTIPNAIADLEYSLQTIANSDGWQKE